jgi:hypothetical protein
MNETPKPVLTLAVRHHLSGFEVEGIEEDQVEESREAFLNSPISFVSVAENGDERVLFTRKVRDFVDEGATLEIKRSL